MILCVTDANLNKPGKRDKIILIIFSILGTQTECKQMSISEKFYSDTGIVEQLL